MVVFELVHLSKLSPSKICLVTEKLKNFHTVNSLPMMVIFLLKKMVFSVGTVEKIFNLFQKTKSTNKTIVLYS